MMIKPPLCIDCQAPLKKRGSQRCHTCANRRTNPTWTEEEKTALVVMCHYRKEAKSIYKQLLKHHSKVSIYKRAYKRGLTK